MSTIYGLARVIAGGQTFEGVGYRIAVVEEQVRRSMVGGAIEATPSVISAIFDAGESIIELGGLGQFRFVVTDRHRGAIKLTGPIKG